MTISAFIEGLPRHGWRLEDDLRIRCDGQCPVVCGTRFGNYSWQRAAMQIELAQNDAAAIVSAADGYVNHDPALRSRLLEHCGLKEAGHE